MENPRARTRDEGLARTASWTRRTAAAAALLCAALATFFAHALPGQAAAPSTSPSGDSGHVRHGTQGQVQSPAQPPTTGSGSGQVSSGAS